jgi:hypothetical protein
LAPPPPKPPAKPGLAGPPGANNEELEGEAQTVEEELEALKARYDQYFLGIERREPNRWRDEVKKKVMRLKGAFTRNSGLKFKIQSLHARYLSYERLWMRSAREKEEGTYRRDLFKARLRQREESGASGADEEAGAPPAAGSPSVKPAAPGKAAATMDADGKRAREAPAPAAPAAASAAPPPLPVKAPPSARPPAQSPPAAAGMGETQMRALYNAYLAAKMTCREDVSKLTYEAVARTVSKQIPELMARYKAKSVEFKVEVKGGKAVLKAVPKV